MTLLKDSSNGASDGTLYLSTATCMAAFAFEAYLEPTVGCSSTGVSVVNGSASGTTVQYMDGRVIQALFSQAMLVTVRSISPPATTQTVCACPFTYNMSDVSECELVAVVNTACCAVRTPTVIPSPLVAQGFLKDWILSLIVCYRCSLHHHASAAGTCMLRSATVGSHTVAMKRAILCSCCQGFPGLSWKFRSGIRMLARPPAACHSPCGS